MGNFNRDRGPRRDFGGGNRGGSNFGGRRSFGGGGGRDRGPREMFNTVCSNCGKDCQVPFRPTGEKPVYCSDCFEKMGGGGRDSRQNERPRFDERKPQNNGGVGQDRSQLESINNKLDRILKLLEPKAIKTELVVDQSLVSKVAKVVEAPKDVETPKVKKPTKKTSSKAKK